MNPLGIELATFRLVV